MGRELSVTRMLRAAVPSGPLRVDRRLLLVSLLASVSLVVLTVIVYTHPYLSVDASIERAVQGVPAGPLLYVFAFYTAIGGPFAIVAEVVVFGIVLLLNRQAWRLVIAAALISGWSGEPGLSIEIPTARCISFYPAFSSDGRHVAWADRTQAAANRRSAIDAIDVQRGGNCVCREVQHQDEPAE